MDLTQHIFWLEFCPILSLTNYNCGSKMYQHLHPHNTCNISLTKNQLKFNSKSNDLYNKVNKLYPIFYCCTVAIYNALGQAKKQETVTNMISTLHSHPVQIFCNNAPVAWHFVKQHFVYYDYDHLSSARMILKIFPKDTFRPHLVSTNSIFSEVSFIPIPHLPYSKASKLE